MKFKVLIFFFEFIYIIYWGFSHGLVVKNLPAEQEMWIQYLGCKDPLEKETSTRSSILACEIPGTEEPGRL